MKSGECLRADPLWASAIPPSEVEQIEDFKVSMENESKILTAGDAQHFLRRTAFGASASEVAKLVGQTRAEAADRALTFPISKKSLGGGSQIQRLQSRWIRLILKKNTPGLQEKLVLFLHDHFATSFSGVDIPILMSAQNQLFRKHCRANLKTLVKAVGRDGAMIEWLDTERNEKWEPNENYSRELLELFTLGTNDAGGASNYAQEDIVQIARAFTGWRWYGRGLSYLDEDLHDFQSEFPDRGPKRIFRDHGNFGSTGRRFDSEGEGENEIDRVVDILFEHRDTDGEFTVARRFAHRLLSFFTHDGYAELSDAVNVVDDIIATSGFDQNWEIAPLVRTILIHDAFWETSGSDLSHPGARRSVTWPIDFLASAMRLLKMQPIGRWQVIAAGEWEPVVDHLSRMGQELLAPPSVFGWDWEKAWLTSSTLLARQRLATDLSAARWGPRKGAFRPERLLDKELRAPRAIAEAVAAACGINERLTESDYQILVDYLTEGFPDQEIDLSELGEESEIDRKIRGLFALMLSSPAFQTA